MTSRAAKATPALIKHFKITLRRSTIGLPYTTRRIVDALGLKRLHYSVYRQQSPTILGMILKLRSIVSVEQCYIPENMTGKTVSRIEANARRAPRGYEVVGAQPASMKRTMPWS